MERFSTRIIDYQKERIDLLRPPTSKPVAVPSGSRQGSLRTGCQDSAQEPIQPLRKAKEHLWHHVFGPLAFCMNTVAIPGFFKVSQLTGERRSRLGVKCIEG